MDLDKLMELVEEDDNLGMCESCGHVQHNIEPDAENYMCEECGKDTVYGAEILLLMTAI